MMRGVRTLRTTIVLLAVGSVAALAAPLVWTVLGHDGVLPPVAQLRAQEVTAPDAVDLGPVAILAPFGTVPGVEQPESGVTPAQLDLSLLGVIVRDDPMRSMALIRSGGDEANFRIGEAISSGVTLSQVLPDHVIVETSGGLQRLGFDGAEQQTLEPVPTGQDRLAAIMATGPYGPSISEQVDAAQRRVPVTTQDYIDLWRDRLRANPGDVLNAIGLVPVENGYMIAEEHDRGVNLAGLRAGDIVKSLNGQQVGNVESDRELYDRVAESGMARIEIERNGRTIAMSFPLQ